MHSLKNVAAITLSTLCLAGYGHADTSVIVTAANLYQSDGETLAPQSTLGLLVFDRGTNGIGMINTGESFAIGSTIGGTDNLIVAAFDLSAPGTDGQLQTWQEVIYSYDGGPSSQKNVALLWFPTLTLADTVAVVGATYGVHEDRTGIQAAVDGSAAWVVWSGSGTMLNLNFFTPSCGAPAGYPDSAGTANLVVVPEPSTLALAGFGLLGLISVIRRRC